MRIVSLQGGGGRGREGEGVALTFNPSNAGIFAPTGWGKREGGREGEGGGGVEL